MLTRLTQGEHAGTSCVFAISPSGSELWRCSIGITGNLDLGGVVVASDGSIIVTAKRTAGEVQRRCVLCVTCRAVYVEIRYCRRCVGLCCH